MRRPGSPPSRRDGARGRLSLSGESVAFIPLNFSDGGSMSSTKRSPTPECRCGMQMHLVSGDILLKCETTHICVFKCPECDHELRLTIWGVDAIDGEAAELSQKSSWASLQLTHL